MGRAALTIWSLLCIAGCDGVTVGEDGDGNEPCYQEDDEAIDASAPLPVFGRSPLELFAPAMGNGVGTLSLDRGTRTVPFSMRVDLLAESTRYAAGRAEPGYDRPCYGALSADATITLDAGPELTATGAATISVFQPRAKLISFFLVDGFETDHAIAFPGAPPRADRKPALFGLLDLDPDGETWSGILEFSAVVPCEGRNCVEPTVLEGDVSVRIGDVVIDLNDAASVPQTSE